MQFNRLLLPFFLISFMQLSVLNAQDLHLNFGIRSGGSILFHDTRFQEVPSINGQYLTLKEVIWERYREVYTWENFVSDFELKNKVIQPRYGFDLQVTYKDWPVVGIVELLSSPSGYLKPTYGATLGFGKVLYNWDTTMTFSFLAGYKYVIDQGFGTQTLLNSIGDKSLRDNVSLGFNPSDPLDKKHASLVVARGGVGKVFGWDKRWTAGVDLYGELDLTEKSVRFSRMTNVGAMLWLRYRL